MVDEHVEKRTLHEVVVTAAHGNRDTATFRKSVNRLKEDGHYKCFIPWCKNTDIQVHHRCEFSLEECYDFDAVKNYLLSHDTYGYSNLLKNQPIETVDDVRNLVCYCAEHHIGIDDDDGGSGTGIHHMTEPAFIAQIVCSPEFNPIPQKGENIDDVIKRIGLNAKKA